MPGHSTGSGTTSPVEYIVDEATGCWLWQRRLTASGYAAVSRDGRRLPAHRWYYERFVGPIPPGLDLDHLCRNRACVNPAHLEPVTRAENIRRGQNAKLTMEKAREIRAASTVSGLELAKRYGVSPTTISHVRSGQRWAETEAA